MNMHTEIWCNERGLKMFYQNKEEGSQEYIQECKSIFKKVRARVYSRAQEQEYIQERKIIFKKARTRVYSRAQEQEYI